MPDFNFNPSISEVRFFRHYYGEDELQPIYNENAGGRAFELVMKLAISGLNYLNNPVSENSYVPFYLNIITYTQRGMRDIVTHGLITDYFDEERGQRESEILQITLTSFYNSAEIDKYTYDFISGIYFVEIFTSNYKINTKEELEKELFSSNSNRMFKTKIPYVNSKFYGEEHGN